MIYALTITIAAGLLLLLLLAGGFVAVRRAVDKGWQPAIGRWRWYPNSLGRLLLLALPLAGLVLWRLFPELLFVPFLLPLVWRWRRRRGRPAPRSANDDSIEGSYRPLDDQ